MTGRQSSKITVNSVSLYVLFQGHVNCFSLFTVNTSILEQESTTDVTGADYGCGKILANPESNSETLTGLWLSWSISRVDSSTT